MTMGGQHTEDCREAFEKRFGIGFRRNGDGYNNTSIQDLWTGFQAAWNTRTESGLVKELVEALEALREANRGTDSASSFL
jgi:hypothetical protein